MSDQLLLEASENLKLLVRLTALNTMRGLPQREQISLLNQGGFSPKQIAELVGTSSNTVRVELSRSRKVKKARK
jgi:DNA-directed RNA polymerase specialized sigma24 family protein